MQRCQTLLNVRSRTAFLRTADEDSDFPLVHFIEQRLFLFIRFCVVDKHNFLRRYAAFDQLVFQIVICVEILPVLITFIRLFRRGQIAEYQLRAAQCGRFGIHLCRVVRAHIQLPAMLVFEKRIETAYVQREFLSIRRDFEHIVLVRIDASVIDGFRAFRDPLRDLHRIFARFQCDRFALRFRYVQLYHIRCLYVRKTAV